MAVTMTVIEIRPHHGGWKVFDAPGVEPVFPETRNDYAAFSRLTTFEDEDIESFLTFLELREKETRDGPNK